MQTISLRSEANEDGILHLEIPVGVHGVEVDVVVVMQLIPSSLSELAGAIDDDSFVEPDELLFEEREHQSYESSNWVDESYGVCADEPIERPDQNS